MAHFIPVGRLSSTAVQAHASPSWINHDTILLFQSSKTPFTAEWETKCQQRRRIIPEAVQQERKQPVRKILLKNPNPDFSFFPLFFETNVNQLKMRAVILSEISDGEGKQPHQLLPAAKKGSQSPSRFCPLWLASFCWWLLITTNWHVSFTYLFLGGGFWASARPTSGHAPLIMPSSKGSGGSNQAEWRANITRKSSTLRLAGWRFEAAG